MSATIDAARPNLAQTETKRLNLGCGRFPRPDCVNVDFLEDLRPDVLHDLNALPYPFETASFDEIYASHVLEHLQNPFAAMVEWHRLLKPGGRLEIKVPHFSRGFTHPDHKRGFDVSFPLYFNDKMAPWYVGTPFELVKMELHWNSQTYLKKYVASAPAVFVASVLGGVIDFAAKLSPMVASRLWCFWVGGFEEIEYIFRKPR